MTSTPLRSPSPTDAEAAAVGGQAARQRAIALMYHALSQDHDRPHDPHYTVSECVFDHQLGTIRARVGDACSARDWLEGGRPAKVLLTFDDGLASDHQVALPILAAHGMTADFFVNPATVGRPGYVGWEALREMSAAGMSVQSHGYDHVHFTRMDPATLRESLYRARVLIEDRLGTAVTLLAPPGGRMPARLAETARAAGYRHLLCSRPGVLDARDRHMPLPRMAVTAGLPARRFEDWITARPAAIAGARLRYGVLQLAKRMIGDARYERLRADALSHHGQ
ncbi:MAG: polysaccharide deacetylase family protein [Lysobacteraceae bacterium]|nr:MAG: polysaccharide deacetylase family protein [Xanthomonadaceae bacterium]